MSVIVEFCLLRKMTAATLQAETQKWFENLKVEVEKRDADIRQLQRSLKESEGLLVSVSASFKLQCIHHDHHHHHHFIYAKQQI